MPVPAKYNSLGVGYDTFKDELLNTIIDFELRETAPSSFCSIFRCESTEDIKEKLEIQGSLSVEASSVNFDAKASFASELSQHSNAVTYIVKAKHSWSARTDEVKLKTSDTAIVEALKQPHTLVNHAGDSYVSFVEVGIEYYAAYQFVARSSEQKKNISGEVTLGVKTGTEVKASIKAQLDSISTTSSVQYTFSQTMAGANLAFPAETDIDTFALNLAAQDVANPMLLRFETASYSSLLNAPPGFDGIDSWRNAYLQPKSLRYSIKATERNTKLIEDHIRAVLKLYTFYGAASDAVADLNKNADGCRDIGNAIQQWKQKYDNGQGKLDELKPNIDCLKIPFPLFDFRTGWSWGRPKGGFAWQDHDEDFIYAFGYPKTSAASPDDGQNEGRSEFTHGSPSRGSPLSFGFNFSPNEIWFTGAWKSTQKDWTDFISGMEVKRRGEQNTNCQLGNSGGPWVGEFVPDGCSFIGFQGRGDQFDSIDNLQPVYVQFKAPRWEDARIDNK